MSEESAVAGRIKCPTGECEGMVPIPKWGGPTSCAECGTSVYVSPPSSPPKVGINFPWPDEDDD